MKKLFLLAFFVLIGCASQTDSPRGKFSAKPLSHAKNFGVESVEGFRILWVKNENADTLRWILLDSASGESFRREALSKDLAELPALKVPLKRIVILSSTYFGFLKPLGAEEKIVGIDSRKNIADSAFFFRVAEGNVEEVGEGAETSAEKILSLNPDAVFSFTTGTSVHDAFPKLHKLKLPVLLVAEWQESTPLARAEWIKFFGILVGREALADSLFSDMEKRYFSLKGFVDSVSAGERPVVALGMPSFGKWYASASNGLMANLVRDAGGKYLWEGDFSESSFSMPFEKAFADLGNADFWLASVGVEFLGRSIEDEKRVKRLPVWEARKIYGNDLRRGPLSGSDFYESAVVKPDSLLLDVAKILHPAYFRESSPKWYRKLSTF